MSARAKLYLNTIKTLWQRNPHNVSPRPDLVEYSKGKSSTNKSIFPQPPHSFPDKFISIPVYYHHRPTLQKSTTATPSLRQRHHLYDSGTSSTTAAPTLRQRHQLYANCISFDVQFGALTIFPRFRLANPLLSVLWNFSNIHLVNISVC